MRLFGKNREHLRIKSARASRAVIALHDETVECNITLITEDGEKLDLSIPDKILPFLIQDLANCYYAIHPQLKLGGYQSTWQGMDNQ